MPAKKKRNTFVLGLTVLVMTGLFVAILLFIAGRGFRGKDTRLLHVRFLAGPGMPELSEGCKVICFGQQVGKILETRFVNDVPPGAPNAPKSQMLEIDARVLNEIDLRADCTVTASGPPLGGKGTIEITDRGRSDQKLDDTRPLYGQPTGFNTTLAAINAELDANNPEGLLAMIKVQFDAADKRSLMRKIHYSLDDVNQLTASLAKEADETQEDRALYQIHRVLNQVNGALSEVVGLLQTNRPRIDNTMESLEHAMNVADTQVVASVAEELDVKKAGSLLFEVHESMARLKQSLENVSSLTGAAQQTVVLNADRVSELVENATEASALLRGGIQDLALHPWKLFAKPGAAQERELQVLQAAREFAIAAAHLDDASSRLKALSDSRGGNVPADDPDLRRIRDELAATLAKFNAAEEALWRQLNVK
jgi:hypothetical protein